MINIYNTDRIKFVDTEIGFNNNSYIVEKDNSILGHFNVIQRENMVILDYELVKQYRNKGLGNNFLKVIENYLYENFDFEKIFLFIKYDNEKSRKIAIKNNYEISDDLDVASEMSMFDLYSKNKEKIKQKVVIKQK